MPEESSKLLSGLRALLFETRERSGRDFLERVTIGLSQLLGGAYVQVGHLCSDARRIRAEPCALSGRPLEPIHYDLVGTPCAHVVGASTRHYVADVLEHFPDDHFLIEHGFVGYLGCPMFSSDGRPTGLLSVLSSTPLTLETAGITVLEALAMRAGADVERVEAVEARVASETLFREIVDQQTEMVCRFSTDGRLTYANRAYLTTFGVAREEIGTRRYEPRLHPDDVEHVQRELAKIGRDRPRIVIENRIFDARDEILWTQWTNLGLFDDDGNLVGYQSAGRDVTEAKLAEKRLQQLYEELRQAHDQKDRFLAMLAHELRNPLGAMLNALAVLELAANDTKGASDALAVAKRQALQQSRLLDDLLDVSRITRGKVELKKSFVSIFEIVRNVFEARRSMFEEKSQTLELELPDEEAIVHADPVRIEQVVTNLLDNATKYTPEGGHVRVEADAADGLATLRIIDDGRGIPAEMLCRVFDMFQQGTQRDTMTSGLGIGLTVVRELVHRHGGTVVADSSGPGAGSTFTIRLPTVAVANTQRPAPVANNTASIRRKVMVVDDNVDVAQMLSELLRAWGHEVITVHDGESAVRVARDQTPDVALIDIAMPGMDGHATARELRREHSKSDLLLVAVTGFGQPSDVQKAHEASFDDHLTKPASHSRLREIIERPEGPLG